MTRRIAHWLLVLALSFSIGLQWALLQSAAWVGMVITYSHQASLPQAIVMTFDGKHPCKVCRTVEKGGASDAKQEMRCSVIKLEFPVPESDAFIGNPQAASRVEGIIVPATLSRRNTPPTPPPERIA